MDLGSLEAPAATMNAHNCYIHITRKKDVDICEHFMSLIIHLESTAQRLIQIFLL